MGPGHHSASHGMLRRKTISATRVSPFNSRQGKKTGATAKHIELRESSRKKEELGVEAPSIRNKMWRRGMNGVGAAHAHEHSEGCRQMMEGGSPGERRSFLGHNHAIISHVWIFCC